MTETIHSNLAVMSELNLDNLASCAHLFADKFVWHYINPKLPDIEGDYRGVSGLIRFFDKMNEQGKGALQVNPVEVRPLGEEFVVVHARNRLTLNSMGVGTIEFDAVVVWRIVNGKIAEAWDIPGVHSVRSIQ